MSGTGKEETMVDTATSKGMDTYERQLRDVMEEREAMKRAMVEHRINPPTTLGELTSGDGLANNTLWPPTYNSDTLTASIPKVENYEKWYKEMRQELADLRKANETIMKLLSEVLKDVK